jgi:hypothetical protein
LDEWLFEHEGGLDGGVDAELLEEFDLVIDGCAGLGIALGAVAGDEERGGVRGWEWGMGMILDDLLCAGEEGVGHAGVGAQGQAVMDVVVVGTSTEGLVERERVRKAEGFRDDVGGEVSLADGDRDHEDGGGVDQRPDSGDVRFDHPEALDHFVKEFAGAECGGVLTDWGSGIWVRGGAVADEYERGVMERAIRHGQRIPCLQGAGKRGCGVLP